MGRVDHRILKSIRQAWLRIGLRRPPVFKKLPCLLEGSRTPGRNVASFIARQVFLLSEMEGKAEPVDDPFGGSLQDYHAAARKMDSIFEKGMQQIIMLAAG